MKYVVQVDERLCDVAVYRVEGDCVTYSCGSGCEEYVGSFSYERGVADILIHSWSFRDYDWKAAKIAVDHFILKWCKTNNVDQVFVERSEADRFWLNLGWDMVGKCEYLERYVGPATTCI